MAQRREKAIEMNTDGSDKLERGPPSPQISISSRSVQAMQSFRIGTLLILLFLPFAALQCPRGTTSWSSAYGSVGAGADVTISGDVYLDVSTPPLGVVTIPAGSGLYFDPNTPETNLTLTASEIYVYGKFFIGCEDEPFPTAATVVLTGAATRGDQGIGFGRKVIGVAAGGELQLHGKNVATWTRLKKTATWDPSAKLGVQEIELEEEMDWEEGDVIVVASTDYDAAQCEPRKITAVDDSKLTLEWPLLGMHYGEIYQGEDDVIDMRAEVGLLTHNVKIIGDLTDEGWGGHIFIAGQAVVKISGVEMYNMGQQGELNRYAINFRGGDFTGSYVRRSSIYYSWQSGIVLCNTTGLNVTENVLYRITGSMFSIEASLSVNNTFESNLGLWPIAVEGVFDNPKVFVVMHPSNNFINNAAVGDGFYFALANSPLYNNLLLWPRNSPLGLFVGNTIHSCNDICLRIEGLDPRRFYLDQTLLDQYNPSYDDLANLLNYRPVQPAFFRGSTIYRASNYGVYVTSSRNVGVVATTIADCRIGVGTIGDGILLENVAIFGETNNVGNPTRPLYEQGTSRPRPWDPASPIYGVRIWDCCGPYLFVTVRFHNFNNYVFEYDPVVRYAGAITVNEGNGIVNPTVKFFNIHFKNVSNRFYVSIVSQHVWNVVIYDTDGSLTDGEDGGDCGAAIIRGPHLWRPDCREKPNWGSAWLCPPSAAYRAVEIRDQTGQTYSGPAPQIYFDTAGYLFRLHDSNMTLQLQDVTDEYTVGVLPYASTKLNFEFNIHMNRDYIFQMGANLPSPSSLTIRLLSSSVGNKYTGKGREFVRIGIPYPSNANIVDIELNGNDMTAVSSYQELTYNTYFFDTSNQILFLHVAASVDTFSYYYRVPFYSTRASIDIEVDCGGNCTVPDINQAALPYAGTTAAEEPVFNLCEINGGFPGGNIQWNEKVQPVYIFQDSWGTGWESWSTNWNTSNQYPLPLPFEVQGTCLVFSWGAWSSSSFHNEDSAAPRVSAEHTHLSFEVRSNPDGWLNSDGPIGINLRLYNNENKPFGPAVSVNNPWYVNNGPISEDQWYTVRIPLEDLGLKTGDIIYRFDIGHDSDRSVTVFIDNISIGGYSVNFVVNNTIPTSNGGSTTGNPFADGDDVPIGAIVGGVIGGLLVIGIVVGLVLLIMFKRDKLESLKFMKRRSKRTEWVPQL